MDQRAGRRPCNIPRTPSRTEDGVRGVAHDTQPREQRELETGRGIPDKYSRPRPPRWRDLQAGRCLQSHNPQHATDGMVRLDLDVCAAHAIERNGLAASIDHVKAKHRTNDESDAHRRSRRCRLSIRVPIRGHAHGDQGSGWARPEADCARVSASERADGATLVPSDGRDAGLGGRPVAFPSEEVRDRDAGVWAQ